MYSRVHSLPIESVAAPTLIAGLKLWNSISPCIRDLHVRSQATFKIAYKAFLLNMYL